MTTVTKLETLRWGKSVRIITDEVAVLFYNSPGWKAFEDVQKWAEENNGRVESAHGILERRIQESLEGPSWQWLTANYEEDAGIDPEGRFGKKGEAVFVAIQGGGIMLSSPESLQAAYMNRTPKGEPSLRQEEISAVLSGKLPNGQQITLYTLQSVSKEDLEKLPQTYAIVAQAKELEETPSGLVDVGKLPKSGLFVMRAGHPRTADDYAKVLRNAGVREYGNWHMLKHIDPNKPSGRVLHVYDSRYYGLGSDNLIDLNARFVGVRQAVGAEGAAPQKTASLLEELAGKGTQVPDSNIYVIQGPISPEAAAALTGRK